MYLSIKKLEIPLIQVALLKVVAATGLEPVTSRV